jgi:hypothetical protein
MLAQADCKVLIAGSLRSVTDLKEERDLDLTTYAGRYNAAVPAFNDPAELSAEPIAGFAQLDVDGLFYPSPKVIAFNASFNPGNPFYSEIILSDGLTKRSLKPSGLDLLSGELWVPDFALGGSITIDGPDATAFTWGLGVGTRPSYVGAPQNIVLHFMPSRAGMHRAVMHVHQPGFGNSFDLALEADGSTSLPADVVVFDTFGAGRLRGGETSEFGPVAFGNTSYKPFMVMNAGTTATDQPIQLNISGANASDFVVTPAEVPVLAPDASARVSIEFKPSGVGERIATLSIGTKGDTGFPMIINLRGTGFGAPVLSTPVPDKIVMAGSSLSLGLNVVSSSPVTWQWFKEGKRIGGARGMSLSIAQASLADAGTYTARATNVAGSTISAPIRVGVYEPQPSQVRYVGVGKSITLACNAAGPGLTYAWSHRDRGPIAGATTSRLVISSAKPTDDGFYQCWLSMNATTVPTGETLVSVRSVPAVQPVPSLQWAVGAQVAFALATTSGEPARWTAVGLPPGIKLDTLTGLISGSPMIAGTFTVRITAAASGGVSQPMVAVVTVINPFAALRGSYDIGLWRSSNLTEGLGGAVRVMVQTNGSFTALMRLASQDLTGQRRGKLRSIPAIGRLKVGDGGVIKSDPVALTNVAGWTWALEVVPGTPSSLLVSFQGTGGGAFDNDSAMAAKGRTTVPAAWAGNFTPAAFDMIRTPALTVHGSNTLTFSVSRTGTFVWVNRLTVGGEIISLTGATTMSEDQQGSTPIFGFLSGTAGARSLIGNVSSSLPSLNSLGGALNWGSGIEWFPNAVYRDPLLQGDFGNAVPTGLR